MTTESQRYNFFIRNGGNAIPKHAGPEAEGSNPTTGLTLLWARNPFRWYFNHCQIARKEAGQILFNRRKADVKKGNLFKHKIREIFCQDGRRHIQIRIVIIFNYALQLLRLIVRSWLYVRTFATRRRHACHHARAPSGGRWNCGREMSRNFA